MRSIKTRLTAKIAFVKITYSQRVTVYHKRTDKAIEKIGIRKHKKVIIFLYKYTTCINYKYNYWNIESTTAGISLRKNKTIFVQCNINYPNPCILMVDLGR